MMFSIITTCRSFENPRFNLIQNNAIESWLHLSPAPQIIVFGNDPGTAEMCAEKNLINITDIEISELGTPYLHKIMQRADEIARYKTLAWVSSDIILFQDFVDAVNVLEFNLAKFTSGVHRHDSNSIDYAIDFKPGWEEKIKSTAILGHPGAGDCFIYSKGFYINMPPFVIGRTACDNWMIYEGVRQECCVDLSPSLFIVHQNHDYPHVSGGMTNNPEFHCNRNLAGAGITYEIRCSNLIMNGRKITKRRFD
jgi:hypothetical protein